MEVATTSARAYTLAGLDQLLSDIEAGIRAKPDWIQLAGAARIERLPRSKRSPLLTRIHSAALRGFQSPEIRLGRSARLALWREIAGHGFHDFGGVGWRKNYASPWVESYDYVGAYLEGGLAALDPYAVYAAVLGTHDYGVEDFLNTELCSGTHTIVEPMSGSAEFCYAGHFRHPQLRYVMFDLDRDARSVVLARRWLGDANRDYFLGNVLDEEAWTRVKSLSSGPSLGYIGKQSHHFFGARDLLKLLHLATSTLDVLILEVLPQALVTDMPEVEDLTRTEMRDAGFQVGLVDEPGCRANPFTHRMSFRLDAWDRHGRRSLFHYPGWTNWHASTLVCMADLLGLEFRYFHPVFCEFVPPDQGLEDAELEDNVTFVAFSRPRAQVAARSPRPTRRGRRAS